MPRVLTQRIKNESGESVAVDATKSKHKERECDADNKRELRFKGGGYQRPKNDADSAAHDGPLYEVSRFKNTVQEPGLVDKVHRNQVLVYPLHINFCHVKSPASGGCY